jgi:excisionase family DNA binding protein
MKQCLLTTKEAAKSLGLRLGTLYGLIWDEVIAAKKDEKGAWLVDCESLERYRLRRNLRREPSRRAMQHGAIDVAVRA